MSRDAEATPWVQGDLTIARDALAAVEAESLRAYALGEEACGYLRGPADDPRRVDELVVLPNLARRYHERDPHTYPRTARESFIVDARRFERAVTEGASGPRPVKVLFHSHLDAGAYFSQTDAEAATLGGDAPAYPLAYLVTSVRAGVVDEHRLFIWDRESATFVPSPFRVEG